MFNNWISGAVKKPGALRKELGVKKGSKIPAKKLAKAAKAGGKEGKRARLAITLKGFKHKKTSKKKSMANGVTKVPGIGIKTFPLAKAGDAKIANWRKNPSNGIGVGH